MSNVNLADVAAGIPKDIRGVLSTQLIDILLNAKGGDKLPSNLAKNFLYLWHKNALEEDEGVKVLLEAALTLDPEATLNKLKELNLGEVAEAAQKSVQKR
ncbi:MAG: hypothetical protein ACK4TI_04590 [Nitrososphaerales archaeon]